MGSPQNSAKGSAIKAVHQGHIMLNDFLPTIVSVGILAAFFLYAWISDIRRIRHFNAAKLEQTRLQSTIDGDSREPLV